MFLSTQAIIIIIIIIIIIREAVYCSERIINHRDSRQRVLCLLYLLLVVAGYDDIKTQINITHSCIEPKTTGENEKQN
jgi:hypothetical protein